MPVGTTPDSSGDSADMGCASPTSRTAPEPDADPDLTTGTSTRAFQSPQVPHRPTQLGWGAPQEEHSNEVRTRGPALRLVMGRNLRTAYDSAPSGGPQEQSRRGVDLGSGLISRAGPEQAGKSIDHRMGEPLRHQSATPQQHRGHPKVARSIQGDRLRVDQQHVVVVHP